MFVEIQGNRKGLYCGKCGKWIKWLNKNEFRIIKYQNVKIINDKRV